jgi:hypothetical protein
MEEYEVFAITGETVDGEYVDGGNFESCMRLVTFLNQKPAGTFPFAGQSFEIRRLEV